MTINWGLLQQPDIGGGVVNAFQQGRAMRRENETRSALNDLLKDPNNADALGRLGAADPETAFKFRKLQTDQAADASKQRLERVQQTGNLLRAVKTDPSKYAMARQAAIQLGIPADTIPEAYDPAWVDQQLFVASAFEKDGGQTVTEAGRYARELGIMPDDPRYQGFVTEFLKQKFAQPYTGAQGETRVRYPDFVAPQQGQPAPAQSPAIPSGNPLRPPVAQPAQPIPPKPSGMTDDEIWAQAHEAVRNGANAEDVFRRLQAWGMNP